MYHLSLACRPSFGAVIGSIVYGIITVTEVATLGRLVVFIMVTANLKFDAARMDVAVVATVKTSAMIFAVIIVAHLFGRP